RQLSQIDSLSDFRRLMMAVALRSGSLLNQTELGRDTGISQSTVHRYLNVLEASHVWHRLPAYAVNRTKRIIKTPKPYFLDSGLAAFLCGDSFPLKDRKILGALLETAVFQHLRAWRELMTPKPGIFYWRTVGNHEVDFVVEWGRKLVAIEVKATDDPKFSHADSLRL